MYILTCLGNQTFVNSVHASFDESSFPTFVINESASDHKAEYENDSSHSSTSEEFRVFVISNERDDDCENIVGKQNDFLSEFNSTNEQIDLNQTKDSKESSTILQQSKENINHKEYGCETNISIAFLIKGSDNLVVFESSLASSK